MIKNRGGCREVSWWWIGGVLIWAIRTTRRADSPAATRNTAFIIQMEELTICHLGDLAHAPLSNDELTHIKDADVLRTDSGPPVCASK